MDVSLAIDVSDGTLLKSICGYKRLRLVEGKRSCKKLFDFYASCSTIGSRIGLPLEEMLRDAREAFPTRGFADVNLVISHRRRLAINERFQAIRLIEEKPTEILRMSAVRQPGLNSTQDMILWQGVMLTAVLDGITKDGVYNSQLLRVDSWDSKLINLTCTEGGSSYSMTHNFCARNMRLAYAMTYASIQGRSCLGSVALWDTSHCKFTRRHLVMGLSRATQADLVWIAD